MITSHKDELLPGQHVYLAEGGDGAKRFAGMISEMDTVREVALIIFYKWPSEGHTNSWVYDENFKWEVDFQHIYSMLDRPVEESLTARACSRKKIVFKQLLHLIDNSSSTL